jgi:hypothetical protein
MAPDVVRIDRVLVQQPYARVIISQERVVNIAAVLDPQGTAAALAERRAAAATEAARTPAERRRVEREQKAADKAAAKARKSGTAAVAAPPAAPAAETLPIRIREVRIEHGRMNFSDYFVEPDFSADVQDLSGTVTGLSSAPDSKAAIALKGKLEEFSPVSIEGEIQPFDFGRHSDLGLRFENISLPIFNPYSGPVAGYNIAKGKLTTVLHYRIENRQLDAQHNIRIDQLEWGEATESQGEATLPVRFATALLKDRNGVITLDVPVGGTLDDPTFRIGPIVWQVIKNIIVKAVTAPFALLGPARRTSMRRRPGGSRRSPGASPRSRSSSSTCRSASSRNSTGRRLPSEPSRPLSQRPLRNGPQRKAPTEPRRPHSNRSSPGSRSTSCRRCCASRPAPSR